MSSNEFQSESNENSKSTRGENLCQESRVKQWMHDFLLANESNKQGSEKGKP